MTNTSSYNDDSKTGSLARWGAVLLLSLLGAGCATSKPAPTTAWSGKSSALDYYTDKCNTGDANACANAARVLTEPASTYHNDALAVQFRTRACNGSAYYCGDLGEMYLVGKGVQKDEQRGLSYLDRSCAAKNTAACSDVAKAKAAKTAPAVTPAAAPATTPSVTTTVDSQPKDTAPASKKRGTAKPAKKATGKSKATPRKSAP